MKPPQSFPASRSPLPLGEASEASGGRAALGRNSPVLRPLPPHPNPLPEGAREQGRPLFHALRVTGSDLNDGHERP
jgi:hypothetical protein